MAVLKLQKTNLKTGKFLTENERVNTIKLHLSHKRHSVPIGVVVEEADVFLE